MLEASWGLWGLRLLGQCCERDPKGIEIIPQGRFDHD